MKNNLIIVDDEEALLHLLSHALQGQDYGILTFTDPLKALEAIKTKMPSVIITDLKMPGMDGLTLLEHAKSINPHVQVIVISGHGFVNEAVAAIKKGAYDFIPKPFNKDEIRLVVGRAFEKVSLVDENFQLREKLRKSQHPAFETGKNKVFRELLSRSVQAAKSDATVLIYGESGTGKEVLSSYIVSNSPRADLPFITVNCAAIPENLIEAELFGYKKGSFTGAYQDKKGKFQEANKGTIFLDEIGELPMSMQSKLLRVIQEGEVSPIGGASQKVDVRIIAATNKLLRKMVEEGQFREDLYYRLNVIPLTIPPLRHRSEDLNALILFFITKFCKKNKRENLSVHADALRLMEGYPWPGNVRELENAIERAVVLCLGNQITVEDLPGELKENPERSAPPSLGQGMKLEVLELLEIQNALKRNQGDKVKTAVELGFSLRTLYRKLESLKSIGPSNSETGSFAG